jgi:hypothetical protein
MDIPTRALSTVEKIFKQSNFFKVKCSLPSLSTIFGSPKDLTRWSISNKYSL